MPIKEAAITRDEGGASPARNVARLNPVFAQLVPGAPRTLIDHADFVATATGETDRGERHVTLIIANIGEGRGLFVALTPDEARSHAEALMTAAAELETAGK